MEAGGPLGRQLMVARPAHLAGLKLPKLRAPGGVGQSLRRPAAPAPAARRLGGQVRVLRENWSPLTTCGRPRSLEAARFCSQHAAAAADEIGPGARILLPSISQYFSFFSPLFLSLSLAFGCMFYSRYNHYAEHEPFSGHVAPRPAEKPLLSPRRRIFPVFCHPSAQPELQPEDKTRSGQQVSRGSARGETYVRRARISR